MRKKLDYDDADESKLESMDGFVTRQIDAAVDSLEWHDYEITIRARARRINKGFQLKSLSVKNRKLSEPT